MLIKKDQDDTYAHQEGPGRHLCSSRRTRTTLQWRNYVEANVACASVNFQRCGRQSGCVLRGHMRGQRAGQRREREGDVGSATTYCTYCKSHCFQL